MKPHCQTMGATMAEPQAASSLGGRSGFGLRACRVGMGVMLKKGGTMSLLPWLKSSRKRQSLWLEALTGFGFLPEL